MYETKTFFLFKEVIESLDDEDQKRDVVEKFVRDRAVVAF